MAAMNMMSAGGFSGVSFHLRTCPQGVASVLYKKTPIFGSRRSKLDHLTVGIFVEKYIYAFLFEFDCAFGEEYWNWEWWTQRGAHSLDRATQARVRSRGHRKAVL